MKLAALASGIQTASVFRMRCEILQKLYGPDITLNSDLFLEKKLQIQNALSTTAGQKDPCITLGRLLKKCHCSTVEHNFIELSVYAVMFIDNHALNDKQFCALLRPMRRSTPTKSKNLKFQLLCTYLQGRRRQSCRIFGQIFEIYAVQQRRFLYIRRRIELCEYSVKPLCRVYEKTLNHLF